MAPKPPIFSPPKINLPELPALTPPRLQPDGNLPGIRPNIGQDASQPAVAVPQGPGSGTISSLTLWSGGVLTVHTQDSPTTTPPARTESNDPLGRYQMSLSSTRTLPAPNFNGFRIYANRKYADIDSGGTVLVSYDAGLGSYRAKLRTELTPSGPALQLNADGKTWRLAPSHAEGQASGIAPHAHNLPTGSTSTPPSPPGATALALRAYIDTTHYVWNPATSNHQGYIVLHRKKGLDKDSGLETYLTFQDDNGLFVEVEPSSSPIDQPADKLSAWTDRDLWDFYGIHSSDITRFRDEAAVTGRKPQWATLRPQRLEKPYLFAELRRWLAPRMSQDEFNGRMAPLNYSVEQWAAHLDWISIDLVARRRLEVHERKLDHLQAQTSVEAKRPRLADEQAEIAAVPDYVTKSLENGALRDQLIEQLRSRTSTEPAVKSLEEITRQIQPYNLSTRQLSRLLDDLQADGRFPQWAEDLKHSSTDETNPNRFDEVYEELLPEIMNIRNRTTHNIDFAAHFTRPFLNALLTKAGYQRNKYNCLYRTDIPAMFRGDDRSPFEFFNGHMRPRQVHVTGSTTQKAVSATFSLSEAGVHTRVVSEVEALLYDTQHHKYPGKKTDFNSTRDSEESDESSSSSAEDSDSHSDSQSDNSPGNSLFWNSEKNYIARRQNQNIGFDYLLDTRGIEVVPGEENLVFNASARTEKKPGEKITFPVDSYEGHISMFARGLSADRIWLINSSGTRAAKVNDICSIYLLQPESARPLYRPNAGRPIEERTWAGHENRHEYDDLIDQVAHAGKPVINLADKEIYSNDIVFP